MEKIKMKEPPWSMHFADVLSALNVNPDKGLSAREAKRRGKQYGANRLKEAKAKSAWLILADQFKNLIVLLLAGASVLSLAFGEGMDSAAIGVVILINAAIGFFAELRAVRSMEALRSLGRVTTKVRRDGRVHEVPAEEVVPGDVMVLEGGDIVTADVRLVEASKLQADESTLTGESLPVEKSVDPVGEDVPLAERKNMLFKGTGVTRGLSLGVVTATGMDTELGRISFLIEEAKDEATPLEKRLDRLGHRLIWLTLFLTVAIALSGIVRGRGIFLMIETAIALAVAAIPEGLPIVATIALARGMWRMARRNALINRLSAVETLGATSVIFTDKTGTLTENRMTVTRIALDSGNVEITGQSLPKKGEFEKNGDSLNPGEEGELLKTLQVGVLCNNASLGEEGSAPVGDPMEVALLVVGAKAGLDRDALIEEMPEARQMAFDSGLKMMATYHERDGRYDVAVKGAPESVLEVSSSVISIKGRKKMDKESREKWMERSDEMAKEGLRVLAFATKTVDGVDSDPYDDLALLGLVGLLDPPREEVREAIDLTQEAGVRVVMVTGDQALTARQIAVATGLVDDEKAEVVQGKDLKSAETLSDQERDHLLRVPIFARMSPEQKLDLISLYQEGGSIVAMTGDGVNDAPALKKADIGVAMGQRGTQVAREAADMVLKDDAFSSIVSAIAQGRIIFDNIRKFALYLISCNVSEIASVALASLSHAPLPILPLQILFLNVVTDVFPALALGVGEGDPSVMKRPPRGPGEPILGRVHWWAVGGYGMIITATVLGSLALALCWLDMDRDQAVTVSFLSLAFTQLWHVFNMRDSRTALLRNDITRNPFIWGALALCTGLLLAAVYVPGLSRVLHIESPGREGWLLILGMSVIPLLVGQGVMVLQARLKNRRLPLAWKSVRPRGS